jgi:hypothetical protein
MKTIIKICLSAFMVVSFSTTALSAVDVDETLAKAKKTVKRHL